MATIEIYKWVCGGCDGVFQGEHKYMDGYGRFRCESCAEKEGIIPMTADYVRRIVNEELDKRFDSTGVSGT